MLEKKVMAMYKIRRGVDKCINGYSQGRSRFRLRMYIDAKNWVEGVGGRIGEKSRFHAKKTYS